ncbi:hypothetical protein FQZ97_908710 [compost metagenome]
MERFSPVTARARTAPLLICVSMGARISTATSTCLPRTAPISAGEPLKGTTCTSTSAVLLNSSAAKFCVLPMLMLPTLSLPGLALAWATSSPRVLKGESEGTTTTMSK